MLITTTIQEINQLLSKKGKKYYKIITSDGNYTCFDDKIIDEISKHIGKQYTLDYDESGDYKNVRRIAKEQFPAKVENMDIIPKELEISSQDGLKQPQRPMCSKERLALDLSAQAAGLFLSEKFESLSKCTEEVISMYNEFLDIIE